MIQLKLQSKDGRLTSRSVFRFGALRLIAALALGLAALATSLAQKPAADLTQASLEDLMNIEVTSVSRKEQKLSKTGAAVYVINQEDIRRSGTTNIPDLLRMVPGVNVARVDANAWAISIRGLNDRYADKVLVLIDGRSVYTPTFSGVYWDQQDAPLENIERIEIIRGPGGAVNSRWRIGPGYSMINMHAVNGPSISRNTPSSEAQLRSFLTLPHNLDWDSSLSYVGGLTNGNIPSYTRLDSRIGWRMGESAEFSIVGQNLLSPRHNEFSFEATQGNRPTEVQRSVFGKITWRF